MNTRISDAAVEAAMAATFADYRADGDVVGQINLPELLGRYGAHHAVEEESMMRAILQAALPHMQPSPGGQDAREQFDAWLETLSVDTTRWGDGAYTDPAAHNYWLAWQAALSARQPVRIYGCCAQPEGELHTAECPNMRHLAARQPVGGIPEWFELVIRDVCELEPEDPDAADTVCIRVIDLRLIMERHAVPPAQAADQQYVDAALHYGAHANRMRLVLKNARACIEAWSHPAIIEHSKQRILQQIDEVLDAYAKREPLPEVNVQAQPWQLQLADALDCFWNAALGPIHQHQDATANAVGSGMVQGVAAVAQRLREHAAGEVKL